MIEPGLPAAAAVLAIATALFAVGAGIIVAFGATSARAGGDGELWRHYGATVLFAAAVLVPAALHPAVFALLAALLAWRSVVELAALHRMRLSVALQAGVAAACLGAAWLGRDARLLMACSAVIVVVCAPIYLRALRSPLEGAARWPFALGWPLLAAGHLSHLVHAENGFVWIALVYATVETQDSMAFLFGKLFGRRPLAPRVSPRKTVEGAIAGLLFGAAIGALIGGLVLAQPWPLAAALALLVVAAGFGGDLFASALKRAAGTKDFAPLHPRHGGLVDIYDSTMAAAPAASLVLWLAS